MFDSRQYEWADLTLILGGRDVTGIRGVSYKEKMEREPLFAKGRDAHSIQSGNRSVSGEIMLLQEEYEALTLAGKGSILNLKGLTGIVNYGNPSEGDTPITDTITGIYFTDDNKELKQGAKNMEITLPFVALRVKRQTV